MSNSTSTVIEASYIIRVYVFPVIIFVGSCLNLLSFFVMKRIGSTTGFFMSILGLVDTSILLIGGVNIWVFARFKQSFLYTNVTCKLFPFIIYSMLDLSVMIIVIVTCERTYAIACPIVSRRLKITKLNAMWILFSTLGFCGILNSNFLYTHSLLDFQRSSNNSIIIQICLIYFTLDLLKKNVQVPILQQNSHNKT